MRSRLSAAKGHRAGSLSSPLRFLVMMALVIGGVFWVPHGPQGGQQDFAAKKTSVALATQRPLQPANSIEAPDFVREAWARDAARRQQERVATAFESRFVTEVPKLAAAISGEQIAALVQARPSPSYAEGRDGDDDAELHDHDGDAGDFLRGDALALAALEQELPQQGFIPARRPLIAREMSPAVASSSVGSRRETHRNPLPVMAFARPDNPAQRPAAKSDAIPWPNVSRKTAVYDVTNAVVYMPDGTKLEAHSGRGKLRDNPKYSHVKMRGATPAATYRLSMREKLFHGVEAIRLNPVDGKAPKGRTGLLAHTYLLRVPGDSSGCVVFKDADYARFLKAFKRGQITHLVVVDELKGDEKPRVASLFGRRG